MTYPLEPTNYHRQVCTYLEQKEPDLWRWAADSEEVHNTELKLHLLKTTYQLSHEAHIELHDVVAEAAEKLGITATVYLYQATRSEGLNVSIFQLSDEAHIVFQGPVSELLSPDELKAVIAHELTHFLLWQFDKHRYLTAARLLERLELEERDGVWANTALRFRQFTEIYADRGAYLVCGALAPCVASLVKLETGLKNVHAESYLKQADQIFAAGPVKSDEQTHPQSYIRAKALQLHSESAPDLDDYIGNLLAGSLQIDRIDILDQMRLQSLTRGVLNRLLTPLWFQTEAVLALARRYFEDFLPPDKSLQNKPKDELSLPVSHQLNDYLAYVLLDFVRIDTSLEELPITAALKLADELGISESFKTALIKEIKIKKSMLTKLEKDSDDLLAEAVRAHEQQTTRQNTPS